MLTGPGGAGKSQLAAEVADDLRRTGWSAGIARLDEVKSLPLASAAGAFVVIDYPEESRAAVRSLLKASGSLERTACPIRLLLVSRHSLEWWSDELMAAGASKLCDRQEVAVGPLDAGQTCALVRDAVGRLSGHFGRAVPVPDDAAVVAWHARDPALHGLPLFAAAAVHAVLDRASTFELADAEIVRALVKRERRRLNGWPEAEAASRLHGLAALRSGLDGRALRHLAEAAPDIGLPAPDRVVDRVDALGWWKDGQVPAPQPDLVAAELLHQVPDDRPQAAPGWLDATLADAEAVEIDRLGRLAHDIATLRGESSRSLVPWLIEAVEHDSSLAARSKAMAFSEQVTFRLAPLWQPLAVPFWTWRALGRKSGPDF